MSVHVETTEPPAASVTAAQRQLETRQERRDRRRRLLASLALPALLVVIVVLFSALRPSTFGTVENLKAVLLTQSVLAVLALAVILPLVIGEFDLSVGANLGLGAIAVTGLISKQGFGLAPAIVCAIAICTGVGLINGLLVAKVRINAFIATLGVGTVIGGLVLWYTDSTSIQTGLPATLSKLSQSEVLGIPLPVVYLLVIALSVWYVLDYTPLGRYMYAIGGSRDASRLAGINVDLLTLSTFVMTGFLCGVGGAMEAAALGVGNPSVGPPLLLPAFAAAFLGATAFKVGVFNVWGTVLAVFTLAAGTTGLALVGVPPFINDIFNGTALIIAVAATRYLQRESI